MLGFKSVLMGLLKMTERLSKTVVILVNTDTWLRTYYFDSFGRVGELRRDFDSRVYALGLKKLKEVDKK